MPRHDALAAMVHRRRMFGGGTFLYVLGTTIAQLGGTFSRASTATYIDANGVLQTVAAGVPREWLHYVGGVPTTLLEGQRTNSFLNSGAPATHTSPSLATGTYTLWLVGTGSIAVAAGTATITGAGTATSAAPVTFTVTVAGTVAFTVTGGPTRAQCENGAFASSYIATAGSAVTRSADLAYMPFAIPPTACTVYAKFVNLGTAQTLGARVFEISNPSDANPRLIDFVTGGLLTAFHNDGTATVQSSAAALPSVGDTVEHRAILNGDGSTALGQAVNAGAEVVSTVTSPNALALAWASPPVLSIGCAPNAATGFAAFRSLKVAVGVQTLATMQNL